MSRTDYSESYDRYRVGAFIERLTTIQDGRDFDLVGGLGVGISIEIETSNYSWGNSNSTERYGIEGRASLGVEYSLGKSAVLTVESLMQLRRSYHMSGWGRHSNRWSLRTSGAVMGIVLYFD